MLSENFAALGVRWQEMGRALRSLDILDTVASIGLWQ